MKKNLNLSLVATFVIAALTYNVANAKTGQPLTIKDKSISATQAQEDNVRIFVNNQQRSLYQIALLSGVSVTELRELNNGEYDKIDVVKIGDSIVLPANSSLLPIEVKEVKQEDKHSYLPKLGSSDQVDLTSNDEVVDRHIATALQTLGQQDWENMSADKVKEDLKNQSQNYAESYVRSQVNSQLIDPIRSAAQDFLGRFGTAQLQFDVSDQAKLNNVNVKLFSPWYDSDNMLLFSQLTYQEYEQDRRIGNFGIGQRWDVADKSWLLGYNVFFDHDFTRNHNCLGLGLEAWADYMKFAANYYTPLSDWKDSKDFDDYLERAARGFDVRFQGYLPSYPHLGASLMYEQYFGDKVALFGKDKLQKDPYAVTVGVDYTPVPLFTIKGEHKQGEGNNKMAKVELTMNYRIGVPVKDQLDPNMVDVAHSLKGSRYDLVDRNNFIVLEYKEKKFGVELFLLGSDGKPEIKFYEDTIVPVKLAFRNAKGNVDIDWPTLDITSNPSFGGDLCFGRSYSAPSGTVCNTASGDVHWTSTALAPLTKSVAEHGNGWSVLVPKYIDPATGNQNTTTYQFAVHAKDSKGRISDATTELTVLPHLARKAVIVNDSIPTPSGDKPGSSTAPASKNQTVKLVAHLEDTRTSTPFNDALVQSNYHPDSSTNAINLAKISELWKVTKTTRAASTINFVDGTVAGATCGSTDCLLIKSIKPVAAGGAYSYHTYELEVATDAALGEVFVTSTLSPYSDSDQYKVYFSSIRSIGNIIFKNETTGAFSTYQPPSGGGAISLTGQPTVGQQFSIEIQDSSGSTITEDYTITWSLIGDNATACPANTILPGDTSNPVTATNQLFAVVQDLAGATPTIAKSYYTIPVNNSSYASSAMGAASPINTSVVASPAACAGDQGFKLRVDIE